MIPLPFVMIVFFIRHTAARIKQEGLTGMITTFFVFYLAYIALASYAGWFDVVSFPPRVLLFTTFPFAFLLFLVVGRTETYTRIWKAASLESLVGLHLFRLIGVFFVLLALHDALPKPFAFIAGFGDMFTAVCSVFVANAIRAKKVYAHKLAFIWNLFGTIDILFTAVAANVLTKLSINNGTMGVDSLAVFPFCIIPAFAPPMILLLHWTIFKKIKSFSV
jgi:hypothetical protein